MRGPVARFRRPPCKGCGTQTREGKTADGHSIRHYRQHPRTDGQAMHGHGKLLKRCTLRAELSGCSESEFAGIRHGIRHGLPQRHVTKDDSMTYETLSFSNSSSVIPYANL